MLERGHSRKGCVTLSLCEPLRHREAVQCRRVVSRPWEISTSATGRHTTAEGWGGGSLSLLLSIREKVTKYYRMSLHFLLRDCLRSRRWSRRHFDYYAMKPNSRQLSCSRLLRGVFQIDHGGPSATIPLHLCPAAAQACATLASPPTRRHLSTVTTTTTRPSQRLLKLQQTRSVHGEPVRVGAQEHEAAATTPVPRRQLPMQCHGCGAFSQTALPDVAGYFNPQRNAVKNYTGTQDKLDPRKYPRYKAQSDIVRTSLQSLGDEKLAELGLDPKSLLLESPHSEGSGYCRCFHPILLHLLH